MTWARTTEHMTTRSIHTHTQTRQDLSREYWAYGDQVSAYQHTDHTGPGHGLLGLWRPGQYILTPRPHRTWARTTEYMTTRSVHINTQTTHDLGKDYWAYDDQVNTYSHTDHTRPEQRILGLWRPGQCILTHRPHRTWARTTGPMTTRSVHIDTQTTQDLGKDYWVYDDQVSTY